nr:hypothetical protein [Pseudomonas viridiflava]
MLDGVEHAQPGIGTVARHKNHFDARLAQAGVEAQQLLDQQIGIALLENLVFVFDLILAVRLDALCHVNRMTVAQIKQRSG